MNKLFEAKHIVMGEPRSLQKSIVMLNRRISWRNSGIVYELDTKHCQRIADALNLKQARTVDVHEQYRKTRLMCNKENAHENPFKKIRHSENRQVNTWVKKAQVYRSTVARLNYWAVDRPDLQHAV